MSKKPLHPTEYSDAFYDAIVASESFKKAVLKRIKFSLWLSLGILISYLIYLYIFAWQPQWVAFFVYNFIPFGFLITLVLVAGYIGCLYIYNYFARRHIEKDNIALINEFFKGE